MGSEREGGSAGTAAAMNKTSIPIPICLTCGGDGFPEWLVFCNKCKLHALHRYCLDGPVIIDEDVVWFCEDCELKKPEERRKERKKRRKVAKLRL